MKCNKKNFTFVAGFSFLFFFFKIERIKQCAIKKEMSSTKITNVHGQETHLNSQIVLGKLNIVGTVTK